jgi:hypothetical protein
MKTVTGWFYRQVGMALAILLAAPLGVAAATPPQQAPTQQTVPAAPPPANLEPQVASLPDSPNPVPDPNATPQQESSAQASTQQQTTNPQTMGTAAAPAEPASGIAASKPAGAAIAPARQKRTRSFVIKLSLLIGGAVAIGTVVALSSASPSRP